MPPYELMNTLEADILFLLLKQKKYQDKNYSARQLAADLHTNTRYMAAVLRERFHCNYTTLVNRYRVADARTMLTEKRYADCPVGEIGMLVGFSTRQTFYSAFQAETGMSPRAYRMKHDEEK